MKSVRNLLVAGGLTFAMTVGGASAEERASTGDEIQVTMQSGMSALIDAARLGAMMQVVATEGARHGLGLETSLFPGRGGDAWARTVSTIQAPKRLTDILSAAMADEMRTDDVANAVSFYATELGRKVAEREVASRRAMLDAAIEAEAVETSVAMAAANDTRVALVDELIETLGLVSANVSGGLNANFAFYRGLDDGGALRTQLSETEMLAMVWRQEDKVRKATAQWLSAYLTLAYAPLSDDELRSYIDFSATPSGRRLSSAMFAGYGRVFEETSYALGLAAARFIAMQDA